jgi:hypothetical protein
VPNSLVLISTASQAFFLSRSPAIANDSVLVLTVKSKDEANKILHHVRSLDWKQINIWKIPLAEDKDVYLKLLKIRVKILALKFRFPHFSKVYIGSYANLVHLAVLAEYENSCTSILLYDGLQLVSVNHFRNKGSDENRKNLPKAYKLLGFKNPKILNLTYISPLDLKITGNDRIEVIKSMKASILQEVDEESIYFIGQPLSAVGMVTAEYYVETLKKFKAGSHNKITYFPHPRESNKVVKELSGIFEIKVPDTIFEEYFLEQNTIPGEIVSFYSSVLVNLIYLKAPIKITSIEIPKYKINVGRFYQLLAPTYEYFHNISEKNFRIINAETLGK